MSERTKSESLPEFDENDQKMIASLASAFLDGVEEGTDEADEFIRPTLVRQGLAEAVVVSLMTTTKSKEKAMERASDIAKFIVAAVRDRHGQVVS